MVPSAVRGSLQALQMCLVFDMYDTKYQLSGELNRGVTGCNSMMLAEGKMIWCSEAHIKWVTGLKHNHVCLALSYLPLSSPLIYDYL